MTLSKEKYQITEGCYKGRVGRIQVYPKTVHAMFYPIEGEYPYRVCKKREEIEKIG